MIVDKVVKQMSNLNEWTMTTTFPKTSSLGSQRQFDSQMGSGRQLLELCSPPTPFVANGILDYMSK